MTAVLKQIENEMKEILKRNGVKNIIKLGDKEYDEARKAGIKTKDCSYVSDDYIKVRALSNAYSILENNETVESFLNKPTSIMWLNGLDFQKKIINLTVEIVEENRK